ncbi:K(+)-transporting ATPase subunit F [Fodinibius salinus]
MVLLFLAIGMFGYLFYVLVHPEKF